MFVWGKFTQLLNTIVAIVSYNTNRVLTDVYYLYCIKYIIFYILRTLYTHICQIINVAIPVFICQIMYVLAYWLVEKI